MKTAFSSASFLLGVLALTGVASAQVYGIPGAGYPFYNNYHHASTVEQGILDGIAAATAAQGQANYFNSLAEINHQDARSRYITNNKNAVDAYFYTREANQSARKPVRLNTEQLTAMAHKAAPAGLTAQDYDSTLGRLHWPSVLLAEEYAPERDALERMFYKRSPGDTGAGSEFYAEVKQLSSTMQQKLSEHISEMDPAQYVAAKNFLRGVTVESTQPLVARSLALR
jgi:hypothetical protein